MKKYNPSITQVRKVAPGVRKNKEFDYLNPCNEIYESELRKKYLELLSRRRYNIKPIVFDTDEPEVRGLDMSYPFYAVLLGGAFAVGYLSWEIYLNW